MTFVYNPVHQGGPVGGYQTLPRLLLQMAEHDADRVFLEDVDGGRATYGETVERAGRWASALHQIGVAAGAGVASMVPSSVEATCLWLGTTWTRGWEAPVHPAFRGFMLEANLNLTQSDTLVIDYDFLDRLAEAAPRLAAIRNVVVMGGRGRDLPSLPFHRVISAEELLAEAGDPVIDLPDPWDTAAVLFTSGTTGPSKGVMVPWAHLAGFAVRPVPFADLTADDVLYIFTPGSHVGAKSWPYLAALLGAKLVIRADFKIDQFLADVRRFGVTTTVAVGAIAHFLEQLPPAADDADIPLRNLLMAPLVPDLDGFRARFGVRIATAYAMTELCPPFASPGWDVSRWRSVGVVKGGWPGVEVRLVDDHDEPVGPGVVGELIVRTAEPWTMNAGYFGMPEATANAWRNGWFHTGDAFTYDDDGFYYFVDRVKDAIRRRGENVSSFEVEAAVNEHPAVLESAAIAVPAETVEDEIKICVVRKPGARIEHRELATFLDGRLPRFMVPRYIEFVDDLPKTPGVMRVQKKLLREVGVSEVTWDRLA